MVVQHIGGASILGGSDVKVVKDYFTRCSSYSDHLQEKLLTWAEWIAYK